MRGSANRPSSWHPQPGQVKSRFKTGGERVVEPPAAVPPYQTNERSDRAGKPAVVRLLQAKETPVDRNYKPTATWINVVLAAILLVSPWVFSFPSGAVTINSVVAGLLVGVVSIAALFAQRRGSESWLSLVLINMVLGAWLFLSPLLLHVNNADAQTWILMLGGTIVAALSAVEVWRAVGTLPASRTTG
jgi:hypothetical protein